MMILLRLSRTTGVSAMFVRMPGQGPRSCAAAPAAVGETILSGKGFIPSPAKWWGPAVLEAECGRTSYWAIREPAPLPSRLAPDGCGRAPFLSFSYTLRTVAEELSRDHKPRGRKGLTCPAKAIRLMP